MFKILVVTIAFFLGFSRNTINASSNKNNEKILCAHPQICNLLSIITAKENVSSVVVFVGDHHHYEPDAKVVKTFIQAPLLITGPKALHPWLNKIIKKRSSTNVTIDAKITPTFFQKYQTNNQETLAHFWLYPDIACDILMQYKNELKKINYPTKEISQYECLERFKNISLKMKAITANIKRPIVITHDALLPLFKSLNANVISLKGSSHHEEIAPKVVKTLSQELKNNSVIWIQESGFEVPHVIKKLIKKDDLVVQVDPNGKMGENIEETLNQIALKLSAIQELK